MALLERWNSLGASARRAALVGLLCLAGCAIFGSLQGGEKPFAFSHRLHTEDQGLGCTDCHTKWDMAEEPGIPGANQCALCHAELDAQKPPEKQIGQLFEGNRFKASRLGAQSDEIVFSHQKHAGRDSDCMACHAALATNDVVEAGLKLSMESCQQCHAQRKAPNDCATCHQVYRQDVPPPNHTANWDREHGRVMRAHNEGVRVERCDTCHSEASCIACHKSQAPDNHTNYWRRRGHGLSASMDRRNCAACHEPESCDSCHSQTQPINHNGSWGSPQDRHCLSCHEPLNLEASCQVCHKSTPSHALATPMPPWHLPAMDCRQCHGNGQPLVHEDNGTSCVQCHH